ncbi:MAG: RNA methyltransferase [Candidatus Bathyarchaeia archaeon]|nr:RNA-binding protein [Candidatus Bathyarchaeota archaeon]
MFQSTLNQPIRRQQKLCVAIPASIVSDVPHLREKTMKIGWIGRALAIFRVDEVIVYPDMPEIDQSSDLNLVSTILSYLETPQYIRRRLFGIMPELRYAGILPPLRTPHHPTRRRKKDLVVNEFREGVVVAEKRDLILVDVGVEDPIPVLGARLPVGARVTVKIIEGGSSPKAVLASREEIPTYWGYKVIISRAPLGRTIKNGDFDLVIATSKYGDPFMSVKDAILDRWRRSRKVLIAFGAPTQGLYEIVRREGFELNELADFIVNTIPKQATETVRTEEAIYATLSILNLLTE